jgi:hypothetical protein
VSQDERKNTSRIDGRKALFIHPLSTCADKGVCVRDGNIMWVSSLRASREIGRESRESRVFSLRFLLSCNGILRVFSLMIFFWRHGSLGFFFNPRNCAFYRYDFRSFAAKVLVASSREMSSCRYDFALAPSKSCSPQAAEALVVVRLLRRPWAARFFQNMENFGIYCERY